MTATLAGARAAWDRFWFAPEAARNLAAARIILAAQAAWILLSRDIPALSALPAAFWAEVPESARWRFLIFEGRPRPGGLACRRSRSWAGVRMLGCARAPPACWPRSCSITLSRVETLFFTPSPWAKGLTLPVLGLLTLSLSPCAAVWSMGGRGQADRKSSAEHGWPLRLVQLLVCQPYLFSGIAKLKSAGLLWASPDNIRAWLLLANQDEELAVFAPGAVAGRPSSLAWSSGSWPWPWTWLHRRVVLQALRRVIVPAAVLFHTAILVTQNYAFLSAPSCSCS